MYTRLEFLKRTFISASLFSISSCTKKNRYSFYPDESVLDYNFSKNISIRESDRIVFQGDSITDSSRNRTISGSNTSEGLGMGYVRYVSEAILKNNTGKNIAIFNRGIAGNTSGDLLARWSVDCISLNPNVLSVLIGVNDLRYHVTPAEYYHNLKQLVDQAFTANPNLRLILAEPFILPNINSYGSFIDNFREYRIAVRMVAKEYGAAFIPCYNALISHIQNADYTKFSVDGFHPSALGVEILAQEWENVIH
ncbi:SGNH/GDSL hydrolase family protein [Danxiaibacter flavus]|uniref:SGNH/GDSL hydrolase family protein n=2 Tax=Danxiaibacter flavus TaxID=3049108 RepID=A0ABV3ZF43_9BACT|nr:SGNH/GDSL hydrolase family protein [Chitinophagaceae bacterium DXS]